jgi:hypothetical protein
LGERQNAEAKKQQVAEQLAYEKSTDSRRESATRQTSEQKENGPSV